MASHDTIAPEGKCPCCSNAWQAATAGFFCQICDETKEEEKSTAVRGLDRPTWILASTQKIIFIVILMAIG